MYALYYTAPCLSDGVMIWKGAHMCVRSLDGMTIEHTGASECVWIVPGTVNPWDD